MGYACPVCDTPQRDGEHLAHHLAFTAMLHGDAHEDWLDEHVADWGGREPSELAAAVTPHAADAEYDEVFEDTVSRGRPDVGIGPDASPTDAGHDHAHDHGHPERTESRGASVPDPEALDDPAVAEAIREARKLTREATATDADSTDSDADSTDSDA